ncbi:hypothetical protein FRB99_004714 [Tulasnella sp. 403]|nr:hypothetical protein FRB99_004714 [Tulasnella sp. 403]
MSYHGPVNPDTRPLPWGFVQRFDQQYNTWYYVNTQTNPPQSSWTHPADQFGNQGPGWQGPPGGGYSPGPQYPQQAYSQPQQKSGMGVGTAAALGVGAGVIGGLVIADQIQDAQEDAYEEGFADGADDS